MRSICRDRPAWRNVHITDVKFLSSAEVSQTKQTRRHSALPEECSYSLGRLELQTRYGSFPYRYDTIPLDV